MTSERFFTALTRNLILAAVLAVVFFLGLPRRGSAGWDYFDALVLAFCFAWLGYYVEVLLLKIPGISTGGGRLIRLAGWFAGGLWCFVVGRYLWFLLGRDPAELPSLAAGGVFFVALQLVLHAALRGAGKPSFFGASEV